MPSHFNEMKSPRVRSSIVFGMLLACFLCSSTARATEVAPLALDEVVRQADAIVVGTITSHQTRWGDASKRWMLTDYKMVVEDIVYSADGGIVAHQTINLTYGGGTIGDEMQALADI